MKKKKNRNAIYGKNALYKLYCVNKNCAQFKVFQSVQSRLSDLINNAKENYYSRLSKHLMNPSASSKTYWLILITFLN